MIFEEAKVFSKENLLEHLVVGHPYHPARPAFLFLKEGYIKLREQINVYTLHKNGVTLIDSTSVYEILEYSPDIDILIVAYNRNFFDTLNLKLNRLHAFRSIRAEFKKGYQASESEFPALWQNVLNIQYNIENIDQQEYQIEIIESLFAALVYQLANIVAHQRIISKQKMSRSQEIAFDFIKLVTGNFKIERNVEYYAQRLMISSRHLTVVLKEVFGKSAIQILNEFVLNEAKAQLSSSLKPINEISNDLKFSDQYSFSHFFKKHENLSPSQYRNQF